MTLADELRTAGLIVLEGRGGRGNDSAPSIDIIHSGLDRPPAEEINSLGLVEHAMAYVEANGRVWLLANGPLGSGPATIVVGGTQEEMPPAQADAVAALESILSVHLSVPAPDTPSDAPDAGNGQGAADPALRAATTPKAKRPRKPATKKKEPDEAPVES